jgi:curved DNA-binding protein CbpA
MKKCYYEILEISIESTEKEIQNAFRKQVKKWHPDISKEANAENIIKEINEAYDILSNKERRYFYNKERGYTKKSPLKVQNHFVIKIKHIYMIATLLIIISFSLGGIIFFFKESNFLKDKKNNSTEIMDKEFGNKVNNMLYSRVDFDNEITINFFNSLNSKKSSKNFSIPEFCYMFNYINKNWVKDSKNFDNLDFNKASELIKNNLIGNSMEYSIIMTSGINFLKGRSRIVVIDNKSIKYAFPELYLGNDLKTIDEINEIFFKMNKQNPYIDVNYRVDKNGDIWINLGWNRLSPGDNYLPYEKEWIFDIKSNKYSFNRTN